MRIFPINSIGQRANAHCGGKRDHILFYEYFHGDNGAGLGASHQTGWTGMVAKSIDLFGRLDPAAYLAGGKRDAFGRRESQRTQEERAA